MILRIFKAYLDSILSSFKRYRRKRGGTWYKVCDSEGAGGVAGPLDYWTQDKPDSNNLNIELLITETYS